MLISGLFLLHYAIICPKLQGQNKNLSSFQVLRKSQNTPLEIYVDSIKKEILFCSKDTIALQIRMDSIIPINYKDLARSEFSKIERTGAQTAQSLDWRKTQKNFISTVKHKIKIDSIYPYRISASEYLVLFMHTRRRKFLFFGERNDAYLALIKKTAQKNRVLNLSLFNSRFEKGATLFFYKTPIYSKDRPVYIFVISRKGSVSNPEYIIFTRVLPKHDDWFLDKN